MIPLPKPYSKQWLKEVTQAVVLGKTKFRLPRYPWDCRDATELTPEEWSRYITALDIIKSSLPQKMIGKVRFERRKQA